MSHEAELSACIDFMARRLPALALYELELEETILSFHIAVKGITQANVSERLKDAGFDLIGIVREAILTIINTHIQPNNLTLQEWVDAELRRGVNPIQAQVRELLERIDLA